MKDQQSNMLGIQMDIFDDQTPPEAMLQEHNINIQRRRKADFDVDQVIEDEGYSYKMKIGEAWEEWSGKIIGETVHGKIELNRREEKNLLDRIKREAPKHSMYPPEDQDMLH